MEKIEVLEKKVETLTGALNEVIACLNENQIYRKEAVDYVDYEVEDEINEESEAEEETEVQEGEDEELEPVED